MNFLSRNLDSKLLLLQKSVNGHRTSKMSFLTVGLSVQRQEKRTVDSLKQSWKRINYAYQRWKEIMVGLHARQQSGANNIDMLNQTHALQLAEHNNQPFNMQHCYDILSNEGKWGSVQQEHSAFRFQPRKMSDESSPGSSNAHKDTSFATSTDERPWRRKKHPLIILNIMNKSVKVLLPPNKIRRNT